MMFSSKYADILIFSVFVLIYIESTIEVPRVDSAFILFALISAAYISIRRVRPGPFYGLAAVVLFIDLAFNYFSRANHQFLLSFVCLFLALAPKDESNYSEFKSSIGVLLFGTMFFAGLHKVVSPGFLTGDYFHYMLLIGAFFQPIMDAVPQFSETAAANRSLVIELNQVNPSLHSGVVLESIFPGDRIAMTVLAWLAVLGECILAILYLTLPTHRVTHRFAFLLILGIFTFRLECGFLIILSFLSSMLLTKEQPYTLFLFRFLITLFLTLLITRNAFY